MADGYLELSVSDLQSPSGVAQLNQMLQSIYNNMSSDTINTKVFYGYGTPEGVVAANVGSIYMRQDGGSNTSVYRKESGGGNTGWVASTNVTLPLSVANGGTGGDFSATVANKYLYFSATGVLSAADINNHGVQVFSASGTFTAPTGITLAYVTMVGGGGGGGGGNTNYGGSGGGSGAYIIGKAHIVIPGNNYTVTINSGGTGGTANNNGSSGGSVVFDGITVAGGGGGNTGTGLGISGGAAGAVTSFAPQIGQDTGVGGTGGGTVNFAGQAGATNATGANGAGGGGAGGVMGGGAAGGNENAVGVSATNYGSGGGGGGGNTARTGGNGKTGVVIVIY